MGAHEVAITVSTLLVMPVAAIYSVARWDASRYLRAPETNKDMETDQPRDEPTRLQKCFQFLCFMAFMAACWAAGWSLQYLPAALRDLGILFLMCGFPALSSTYGGAVLFDVAHEVLSVKEIRGKPVLQCETIRKSYLQRALAAFVCGLILSCTYFRFGQTAVMAMISTGMMFSSSLLMGIDTKKSSPSLRTSAKWNAFMAAVVIALAYTLPLLVNWLSAKFDKPTEKKARIESPLTAWTDSATQVYTVVVASMWASISVGVLLSRLYRIDVANSRRKTMIRALDPALRPRYLLENATENLSVADDGIPASDGGAHAIRIMSPREMYTTGTLLDLVHTPWYSGTAYLCLAAMLLFAMPTLLSHSPMMHELKREAIEAGVFYDESAWLSSNICIAMFSSTYLALLPIPMILGVAFLALIRRESGFVWNERFDWASFTSEGNSEPLHSDEK